MASDPTPQGEKRGRGRPKGSGKPPGLRTVLITLRLPEWLADRLKSDPAGPTVTGRKILEDHYTAK